MRLLPLACAAFIALAGCAAPRLAPVAPSLRAIDATRQALPRPIALGTFGPAPTLEPRRDSSLAVRAMIIRPPQGGSFSTHLRASLEEMLRISGRLDAGAPLVLSGRLTENQLGENLDTGNATLGATFILTGNGTELWRGEVRVSRPFNSSLLGVIAYQEADRAYGALFGELAEALMREPGLRAAIAAAR